MGKRNRRGPNPFAQRKRDKREADKLDPAPKRHEQYKEIVKENENFLNYYKHQKVCPEDEWELFLKAIRSDLPTTFRVTSSRGEAKALLDIIKNQLFTDYLKGTADLEKVEGTEIEKPFNLPWYPNELAWQLLLTRKDIRRSEHLSKLHNFLIAETNVGSISRQEAVSMIPPLVLDVQPHHKVLDMCAAPGSKTAQLIEALHSDPEDKLPTGFVIANDVDNNRCYMLVHQAKRMNSPCFLVTNHDSSFMPNFTVANEKNEPINLKFDRILCDVPCSGDGTLRKNPDIWNKWNHHQGTNLNGIQYRILKRGSELLKVGGRLVYSTCSLNPLENEAVLCRILKESRGALNLVDASASLPGLKYKPGMNYWEPGTNDQVFYKKWEDVPPKWHTIIRPHMFAPDEEEIKTYHMERSMRILPHQQNTGGFFVAIFEKSAVLPWEGAIRATKKQEEEINKERAAENNVGEEENSTTTITTEKKEEKKSVPWGPQRKKHVGYKEDPYVFFKGNEEAFNSIKSFYCLNDDFDSTCLLTRSEGGKMKNIYFCSKEVQDLVTKNEHIVKIINTGVKTFARCDNKNSKCAFRLAQEGLGGLKGFIGPDRRAILQKEDLVKLLQCDDPTKPPEISSLTDTTQVRIRELSHGSCVLQYNDDKLSLTLVGWRGTHSLRAYVDSNETVHVLRLLGADISKYEINKFKKDEETKEKPEEVKESEIDAENGEPLEKKSKVEEEVVTN